MLRHLALVLVCSYFIREAAAVSCSTNSDCAYGGSNCQCKCCLIGLNLDLLNNTLTTSLCVNILRGTVTCCDNSGPTIQQCTNHTSPPTTKAPTTIAPTELPTEAPTTAAPTPPPTCQDPSRACPRKECLDLYSQCAGWAKLGYCNASPERAEAMAKNCPVSCGYCDEICEDYDCPDTCAAKALAGECLSNPEYMLVRCKKTCTYCDRCTNLHTACPYIAGQCTDNAQIPQMYFYCRATCGLCTQISNCSILEPISQRCPRDWFYSPLTDKCYWGTPNLGLRQNIQARCAAEGGDLASIHSVEENNYLSTYLPTPPNQAFFYFHGLYRTGGTWAANAQWQDNSIVNYVNWDAGQPSGFPNELNAGLLLPTGVWHDFLTTDQYPGFCQKEACPIPTTDAPTTIASL